MSVSIRPRICVIGLGAMGLPMATCLDAEFSVTGYDPMAASRSRATDAGLRTALTAADAARDVSLVLLAVRDQAQVEDALFGANGVTQTLAPGSAVILTSTIGAEAAAAVAARLELEGFTFVDAPVSGGPVRAGAGDLLIVVGADQEALATARPALDRLASTLIVVGPRAGDGQLMKTINQLLAGVHIAAAAEAIALARGVGLDPQLVIDSLSQGAGASFMFSDRAPRMLQAYSGGAEVKSRVDIFVKDMGIVTDAAKRAHVATPLASAAQQLYLIAEAAGLGASDDSSIVTVLSPIDSTADTSGGADGSAQAPATETAERKEKS